MNAGVDRQVWYLFALLAWSIPCPAYGIVVLVAYPWWALVGFAVAGLRDGMAGIVFGGFYVGVYGLILLAVARVIARRWAQVVSPIRTKMWTVILLGVPLLPIYFELGHNQGSGNIFFVLGRLADAAGF